MEARMGGLEYRGTSVWTGGALIGIHHSGVQWEGGAVDGGSSI